MVRLRDDAEHPGAHVLRATGRGRMRLRQIDRNASCEMSSAITRSPTIRYASEKPRQAVAVVEQLEGPRTSPTSCITSSSARFRISAVTIDGLYAAEGHSDHPSKHAAMEGVRSPAQVFALVIGATLTVAGIVGFFYNADFGTGDGTARDAVLGILDVNGWHNVVHIVTGALGLLVASSYSGSRAYALGLGAIYPGGRAARLPRRRR